MSNITLTLNDRTFSFTAMYEVASPSIFVSFNENATLRLVLTKQYRPNGRWGCWMLDAQCRAKDLANEWSSIRAITGRSLAILQAKAA